MKRSIYLMLASLLLSGCVGGPEISSPAGASLCGRYLDEFEALVHERDVWLSEPRPVPGFPALGTNRLLASFADEALDQRQREDWLERLLEAGRKRRALLHGMLTQRGLEPRAPAILDDCAAQQLAALSRDPQSLLRLAEASRVTDDYLLARRVLGLYPLTSLAAKTGIRRLHAEQRQVFSRALDEHSVRGELALWSPDISDQPLPRDRMPPLERDSLGTLLPEAERLLWLADRHAPLWLIDVTGDHDRPGEPYFAADWRAAVDTGTPVVYAYASLTRFASELRLQLNYLLWFSERPASGALDSLAGRLDGVLWRVTLDDAGEALAYDSVHACGCYHWFFATPQVRIRNDLDRYPEPPFVAGTLASPEPGQRVVLRLAGGTHYLQGADRVDVDSVFRKARRHSYVLRPYSELYSRDSPAGPTSLFHRHGLIPGTQRGERYFLWPMGIRSAGAMRERGRHATAFLGRRHFDEAFLLDAVFTPLRD